LDGILAFIAAVFTPVHARVRLGFIPPPQKILRRNRLFASVAIRLVQRLQVYIQAFFSALDERQVASTA